MKVNGQGAVKLYNILVAMKFPVSRSVGGVRIILRRNYCDREGKEARNCSNTAVPDGQCVLISCVVCARSKGKYIMAPNRYNATEIVTLTPTHNTQLHFSQILTAIRLLDAIYV